MTADGRGAATGEGSGAPSRVLVIGFGNTLRRDDGVGAVAAERMSADARFADVEVRAAYQLLPEMAADMTDCSLVVFVDADPRARPGSVEVRPLDDDASVADADARARGGTTSHRVGPGELMALTGQLAGRQPEAVVVAVGAADMELGEGLSPATTTALPRVLDAVLGVVERQRAAAR